MPTAILSVHNKTGLVEFAQSLASLGWNLLASGGTAKLLREKNVPVTEVADYTKSPEILGGRVKTLHPAIHGGLLARPTDEDHQQLLNLGWDYIDLVAVNLYPFEETIAQSAHRHPPHHGPGAQRHPPRREARERDGDRPRRREAARLRNRQSGL